jgi:hypothetical protein
MCDQSLKMLARFATALHQPIDTIGNCKDMKIAVDDGKNAHVMLMNSPEVGLYVPPMIWSVQFGHTQGAVLLVMASEPYDRGDYISDYAEFIERARQSCQTAGSPPARG